MKTTVRPTQRLALIAACLAAAGALTNVAYATDDHSQHQHQHAQPAAAPAPMDHSAHMAGMDHSAHMAPAATGHEGHAMPASDKVKRSEAQYKPAAVSLVRADGKAVTLAKTIDDGRPVMLNFIYTTCTAICPVTTQVFSEVRAKLGADRAKLNVVSISIDPEYDTPARLTEYAKHFNADASWTFMTGTAKDSIAVQKSFAAYNGDKMNHVPVTFLRAAPGKPWVRVDGFASPDMLLAEVRKLLKS